MSSSTAAPSSTPPNKSQLTGRNEPTVLTKGDESDRTLTLNRRTGYDPFFLSRSVALPALTPSQLRDTTRLTRHPDQWELKYQHFSLVMSRSRRLPFFTAVNIDGRRAVRNKRTADRWRYDPRIPEDTQLGSEIYDGVDLDYGHLVRRLDPAWGEPEVVQIANDDTFFLTNCAPQHKNLNRNKSTWAGLEDYILSQAIADQDRVTVFTGPVFGLADRPFRGVLLPQQFWKLVALVKQDGTFSASAYLLSQFELLAALPIERPLEPMEPMEPVEKKLTPDEALTFQIPVYRLERITQLTFDDLVRHDPLLRNGSVAKSLDDVTATLISQDADIQI